MTKTTGVKMEPTTIKTKVRRSGNSDHVTLTKDILRTAELAVGDEVTVEATSDKIVITKSESDYARAMRAGRECTERYAEALAELAK